jgi:hypothetical protein
MSKFRYALAVTALTLAIGSHAASAQALPQEASCEATLKHVTAEWDAIGFATPMKPSQAQVVARDGHVASGPEVTWLGGQLRHAAQDCALGHDADGLHRLDLVQDRLNHL